MHIRTGAHCFDTTLESTIISGILHILDLKIVYTAFWAEVDSESDVSKIFWLEKCLTQGYKQQGLMLLMRNYFKIS